MVSWGSWREDILIGATGVWLENIRVRDQKQALICGTCEACSLWLRPEMRMESQDIGKFNTRNMKLDELLMNFWSIFDELLMKCEWYSIKKILYQLDSFCNTGHI